jgi:hypothetical protein
VARRAEHVLTGQPDARSEPGRPTAAARTETCIVRTIADPVPTMTE